MTEPKRVRAHVGAPLRLGPLVAGVLIALACFVGFWELAEDFATSPAVTLFDTRVSDAIIALRTPALTQLVRLVTNTGNTVSILVMTAVLVFFMVRRRHPFIVGTLLAIAGGATIANRLKDRFGRMRPPAENALIALPGSFSFPSGHAMASLCVAVAVSYVAIRSGMRPALKVASIIVLALWALAVGLSRVYLGVHWPSDVIASWLLGAGWVALIIGYAEARREMPQS